MDKNIGFKLHIDIGIYNRLEKVYMPKVNFLINDINVCMDIIFKIFNIKIDSKIRKYNNMFRNAIGFDNIYLLSFSDNKYAGLINVEEVKEIINDKVIFISCEHLDKINFFDEYNYTIKYTF